MRSYLYKNPISITSLFIIHRRLLMPEFMKGQYSENYQLTRWRHYFYMETTRLRRAVKRLNFTLRSIVDGQIVNYVKISGEYISIFILNTYIYIYMCVYVQIIALYFIWISIDISR